MDYTQISRILSHALRHEPWLYELELDDQGWTPVAGAIEALASQGFDGVTEADLAEMISAVRQNSATNSPSAASARSTAIPFSTSP